MKLENQVCSLELSKKLKELGFKQDSCFYWSYRYSKKYADISKWFLLTDTQKTKNGFTVKEALSAYTVAELINMLRNLINSDIIIPADTDNVVDYIAGVIINHYEKSKI